MQTKNRRSGVLMHVSSLPGEYSIGSFGKEARDFVDILAKGGFKLWQVLPFCMTDECNSPYKSPCSFGANPYFIDLPTLYEKGLITLSELEQAKQNSPYLCEYDRLSKERLNLLYKAAMRIYDRSDVINYINEHEELDRVSKFLALRDANDGKKWQDWNEQIPIDKERLFFWQFVQYEFYTQWFSLKQYANQKGVKIIGDLPIYVALDSADVFFNKEQFLLNATGYPTELAGVPPDYFSEDGQLWGNPLYNWKRMKKDGYAWWTKRLRHAFALFDGVRIDHFRGFESYWSVPAKAKSAKEGRWVAGPRREFIRKIKDIAGDNLVIAEDLGDITNEVRELVDYSGFPGMRVLQFAFLDESDSLHLPHNYISNTVAYTGTHDNNTLLGYVWEMSGESRERALKYTDALGCEWSDACKRIINMLFRSHSDTVILPIQDLLLYGADTRMNTPGTNKSNWTFRISINQLLSIDYNNFKTLNSLYKRG